MGERARFEFQFTNEGVLTVLELDAVLTQAHTSTAIVTKHPIEKGARPSDHIAKGPESFQIDAVVAEFQTDRTLEEQEAGRPSSALSTLLRIQSEGILVSFKSRQRSLDNLALSNLSWGYVAAIGGSFHFTATLEEVIIFSTRTVLVQKKTSTPGGNKPVDRGVAPTEPQDLTSVQWELDKKLGLVSDETPVVRFVPGRGFLAPGGP